ncbi:putative RNA-directed DNA polymerase from transposon X-element [Trichonephila clavipes]|uniref:Putative RNA-directed DNA polymerase from transposon X-element n=1 Tax=Trichonephila clavipes TaxID=2585209 RepID=A0A8X7BHF0_TRICX|nr:putative RNA-directed DNA polymerase from transposon X-element [Trichonephila clavipes]
MLIVRQHLRTSGSYGESFADIPLRRISWRSKRQKQMLVEVWKEHCFRSSWKEAIVIPILKPGKVATDPLSYRPIALTSCLSVRYFNVRIGHSSSHKFIQDQGVPQGSVLSVTLFNIHMSNILHQLPPSVRGMLYVDDLQVSCQGSDMRLIERQLQTTVNRLVQWCDQNGHTISPSKSSCVHFCRKRNLHPDPSIHIGHIQIPVVSAVRFLGVIFDCKLTFLPHVLYLRKRCERSLNILKVLSNTLWGADRVSLLRVYHALILSRLDYGCAVYGSARASLLKRLDTVHHSALRICSGAFRTSLFTILYVVCHQPPLELRRRQLSANYFIRAMPIPSQPLKPFALAIGLNRLNEARSFNIKPFSERAKAVLNDAHLNNINIQENNILAFPPWDIQIFNYHNPFRAMTKQALLLLFISNSFLSITVNILSTYQSTRQLGQTSIPQYTCHPVVCTILVITSRLYSKGFDIVFCWLPSHVGIIGNEQADSAAKSATTHLPLAVPLSDMKRVIMHHIFKIWQESWSQQLDNKLHSVKPVIGAWPVMPMRRTDVKLTRLRIGHTRFTHRHLLFGERAPECPSCHVSYTVHHVLIDCPVFNTHRMTFFHQSVLTLSDLVGESPHQNLFAFIRRIGFLYLI